jgi:hypothetical protein
VEDGFQGLECLGDIAAVQQHASQRSGYFGTAARVGEHWLGVVEYRLGLSWKVQRPVEVEGPGDSDLNAFLVGSLAGCHLTCDRIGGLEGERFADLRVLMAG